MRPANGLAPLLLAVLAAIVAHAVLDAATNLAALPRYAVVTLAAVLTFAAARRARMR